MGARSIRFALECGLARAALAVIPRMPRGVVVTMSRVAGALAPVFARHLHKVGMANLDIAFGTTKSKAEKRRILRASCQTFSLVMLDMFWFARDSERRIKTWVSIEDRLDEVLREGAKIFVTAHMGNWEVHGQAMAAHGYPLTSVAAPLANRRLDDLFLRLRDRTGQRILSKHGAVRGLLKTLKSGGKVALVMDQNTKPSEGGVFVDFFGLPAPISSTVASLAIRTGAEVLVGVCLPDDKGRYHAAPLIQIPTRTDESSAPVSEDQLTIAIAKCLEGLIRSCPEQWVWMYKRWKYVAPRRRREEYPFYAKQLSSRDAAIAADGARITTAFPPG